MLEAISNERVNLVNANVVANRRGISVVEEKKKRAELAGADKAALEKSLQEIRALEDVLDGKAAPEKADESGKNGVLGSILKLLGRK